MDTNLPYIKSGKPKSIKKPLKTFKQKFENSFTVGTFKLFYQKKCFCMITYHPVEGTQHQLDKTKGTRHKWPYLMNM